MEIRRQVLLRTLFKFNILLDFLRRSLVVRFSVNFEILLLEDKLKSFVHDNLNKNYIDYKIKCWAIRDTPHSVNFLSKWLHFKKNHVNRQCCLKNILINFNAILFTNYYLNYLNFMIIYKIICKSVWLSCFCETSEIPIVLDPKRQHFKENKSWLKWIIYLFVFSIIQSTLLLVHQFLLLFELNSFEKSWCSIGLC